MPGCMWQKKIG